MRRWGIAMLMAAALAALGWLGWSSLDGIYLNQRAALKQRIGQLTSNIQRYEAGVEDQTRVAEALGRYADGSMGGDLETVDHQLRSRLNRIGEEIGMAGLTVGTGRARNLQSPAKSQFRLRGQRALRDETDFVEVEAWISGQAEFEQVLQLVHRVREEPWLKRIHQVRLWSRRTTASASRCRCGCSRCTCPAKCHGSLSVEATTQRDSTAMRG